MTAQNEDKEPESLAFYTSGTGTDGPIKVRQFNRDQLTRSREMSERRGQVTYRPDKRQLGNIKLHEEVLSFLEGVTLIDPIGKVQGSVLEEEFQSIKFSGKYDDTIDALRQVYDEKMHSWELFAYLPPNYTRENRTAFMYAGGRPVYVDDLGDGVKYGFAALTFAHNRHNTALLLEEIETHQHPSALRKLIKFLVKIAKENNLQLFVSTQSPDVLRYFKIDYPETKVFLIEKDPTKNLVYANDEENTLRVFREVGWDIEDLLRYEKIAIVDGIEDELIIKSFFQKTRGYPLESDGIRPLIVRGDRKKLGEIIRTIAVSSREVLVIKDLDEMKTRDEVVALVVSWLRSLEGEGWDVEEDEQQVTGEHVTSHKQWKVMKKDILKAGNVERFPSYTKHSITDYILEAILDNPKLASEFAKSKTSGYQMKKNSSKEELGFLLEGYNMEKLAQILQAMEKELVPNSIKRDIINLI
jgi:predicted house-cleaning noncanonical NTP pyrophosphatase (MazG superfamily)